uniref:Putative secreted protein n=1 Tax=Anopheles marajoara TaxID=58244 RepID=A0A2M4CCE3_9DIPT
MVEIDFPSCAVAPVRSRGLVVVLLLFRCFRTRAIRMIRFAPHTHDVRYPPLSGTSIGLGLCTRGVQTPRVFSLVRR